MNKSLFETRQKSIDHYNQQLQQLEATRKEIEDVRRELIESLVEFFPFQIYDIIIRGNNIIMIITVHRVTKEAVEVKYSVPDGSGGWKAKSGYAQTIRFEDIKEWRKIN